ncbi:MAG: dethiobiotin synthase [Pseudomonadota bacterium]
MKQTFFVTGTDTEVGKTAISCALLKSAMELGLSTAAIKPVAAGCDADGHNEDALLLMDHMSAPLSYERVNPVALDAAIAPHIAAAEEGRHLQVSRLAGLCRGVMLEGADVTLIEGAGGWRVPLNAWETLADLVRELNVEVILVVALRLGCLNHALLTAEAIRRDGLRLAGWVGNQPGNEMTRQVENIDTLEASLGAPCLGLVPRLDPFSAEGAAQHIDFKKLLGK